MCQLRGQTQWDNDTKVNWSIQCVCKSRINSEKAGKRKYKLMTRFA